VNPTPDTRHDEQAGSPDRDAGGVRGQEGLPHQVGGGPRQLEPVDDRVGEGVGRPIGHGRGHDHRRDRGDECLRGQAQGAVVPADGGEPDDAAPQQRPGQAAAAELRAQAGS
jgi:hypothetical protein